MTPRTVVIRQINGAAAASPLLQHCDDGGAEMHSGSEVAHGTVHQRDRDCAISTWHPQNILFLFEMDTILHCNHGVVEVREVVPRFDVIAGRILFH